MTKNIVVMALFLSCAGIQASSAAGGPPDYEAAGKTIQPAPPDPEIAAALQQVSPERIRATIETLVGFHNRNTLSSMDKNLKPGEGVLAAADWIEKQFKSYSDACGGCLDVKRDTFTALVQNRILQPTTVVNVYAVLRGSDPAQASRIYLVTGHYDSRDSDTLDTHGFAPGANDDASGVAVSLECARVLSRHKFPATLVFAAVAGEEQGLVGSGHLAQLAKQEGWQLGGVLNNDIVGGNTTPGDKLQDKSSVRVFSEGIPETATLDQIRRIEAVGTQNDSPSRELAREICDVAKTYFPKGKNGSNALHPVLEFRRDRFLRGGDHMSFTRQGFTAVRFTEWREDFNHQHQNVRTEDGVEYGDELKFVDFRYVANVTRLNAATLAALASAPGEPADVQVITRKLDNNTELRWKAPSGVPPGTVYQIVWRATTSPDWQYGTPSNAFGDIGSGEDRTAILPVSKDNVIFGVQSVDLAGHRSAAVTPDPKR